MRTDHDAPIDSYDTEVDTHLPRFRLASLTAAAALCSIALLPATGSARVTLVYDETRFVEQLVRPASGPGLTPARGALRQDPGSGGMLTGEADESPYKVSKVSGAELATMTADQMAATLRQHITEGDFGASSHLVAIDEIGKLYGDLKAPPLRKGAVLPPVDPSWAGSRFSQAMQMLESESPFGGTWASRVHVYLAPAVHTAIGAGKGTERNLGRDGKPHFMSWRAVMPGLARAGGVHLQMYHGYGSRLTAFTAREWRTVPAAFVGLFGRYGGNAGNVHFLFSSAGMPAGSPAGCGSPVACSWTLAESTATGAAIIQNGPGVYRIAGDAPGWLVEFNKRFS